MNVLLTRSGDVEALSIEFDVQMVQKRIPNSFWKRVNVQMVAAPHDGEAANPCQGSVGGEPKVSQPAKGQSNKYS